MWSRSASKKKLAAILATGIVGYSRLMRKDPFQTFRETVFEGEQTRRQERLVPRIETVAATLFRSARHRIRVRGKRSTRALGMPAFLATLIISAVAITVPGRGGTIAELETQQAPQAANVFKIPAYKEAGRHGCPGFHRVSEGGGPHPRAGTGLTSIM